MPVKTEQSRQAKLESGAPLLRTYSGLGILKGATETPYQRIEFVDPEKYHDILEYPWNKDKKKVDGRSYYSLEPTEVIIRDYPNIERRDVPKITRELSEWLNTTPDDTFVYEPTNDDAYSDYYAEVNRALGLLRRYVLIIMADAPPADAYVAHFDRGVWYYIDGNDVTSQKNFDLISLFVTMMAVPSTTPPLSPTISVGGM
jgi:hypothetical protein